MSLSGKFTFEVTADGSPTVRIQGADSSLSEAMHSLRGAFSETVYIYGAAIEKALSESFTPRILSMGLGLGYVELLATGLLIKADKLDQAGGESFEIVHELREWFEAWLRSDRPEGVPAEFISAYDEILTRVATHVNVDRDRIRAGLAKMVDDGRWKLSAELGPATQFSSSFGCICFDAFSSKTSPDLWSESFLVNFLKDTAADRCVLSTYACTGALKRALRSSGFSLDIRMGFSSKRDSTFAVRS